MQLTKNDIIRALESETRIMERQRLLKQLWKLGDSEPDREELAKGHRTAGKSNAVPAAL